jgi:hypothetical protein
MQFNFSSFTDLNKFEMARKNAKNNDEEVIADTANDGEKNVEQGEKGIEIDEAAADAIAIEN